MAAASALPWFDVHGCCNVCAPHLASNNGLTGSNNTFCIHFAFDLVTALLLLALLLLAVLLLAVLALRPSLLCWPLDGLGLVEVEYAHSNTVSIAGRTTRP